MEQQPHATETGADELGPKLLLSMLEEAVSNPDSEQSHERTTDEQIELRQKLVDQTWEKVREWLRAHPTKEERAEAATMKGRGDATPLHLMFRLGHAPIDAVKDLVDAAPEIVKLVDSHGWLPLHQACSYGASQEVFEILLTSYPEGKIAQDKQSRTPLHFYTTHKSEDINPTVMEMLCNTGAAKISDKNGMFSMHYACAYGYSPAVLKILADACPESVTAKDCMGRTPVHFTMANCCRDAAPGVLEFLLQGDGKQTVDWPNNEGNLPVHPLNLGTEDWPDDPEEMKNAVECIKLYLASYPIKEDESNLPDLLAALKDLPEPLRDVAAVQDLLNKTTEK